MLDTIGYSLLASLYTSLASRLVQLRNWQGHFKAYMGINSTQTQLKNSLFDIIVQDNNDVMTTTGWYQCFTPIHQLEPKLINDPANNHIE